MMSGSYEVESLDHPGLKRVIHLEVVDRETVLAYEFENRELRAQVVRLMAENKRLRDERDA